MECFTKRVIIFTKHSILDVWHGSEYTSGFLKLFCCVSQRDTRDYLIYAQLIIEFTPNLEFSPYSEFIHGTYNIQADKG